MAMMLTNNDKNNSIEFTLLLRLTVIISFLLNKIMLNLKLFAVTFFTAFSVGGDKKNKNPTISDCKSLFWLNHINCLDPNWQ